MIFYAFYSNSIMLALHENATSSTWEMIFDTIIQGIETTTIENYLPKKGSIRALMG